MEHGPGTELAEGRVGEQAPSGAADGVTPVVTVDKGPPWLDRAVDRLVAVRVTTWITLVVVVASATFVALVLHPRLILTDTLPTGGDMGAHVWSPAYLRDHLLPKGRLVGWTPDWYAGFPAFQYYMVLPSLAVVLLYGARIVSVIAALAGAALVFWHKRATGERARWRLRVAIGIAAGLAVLTIGVPYGVAFKIVAVSGLVGLPVAAWALGKLSGMAFPGPAIMAVATLPFLFDRAFNIYGGNIASTMAGEFAFAMSLALSLVYLGFAIHALDTGRHRGWAALLLALAGLSHLFPAVWALMITVFYASLRLGRTQLRVLLTFGPVAGLLGAFWALPFYARTTYMNDMGWGKLVDFKSNLLTRNTLASDFLRDSPPLEVIIGIAAVGFVLSVWRRNRLGIALAMSAATVALLFIHRPEERLWNGRMLPFYYLSLYLLAAIGVVEAVRLLIERKWARWFAIYAVLGLVVAEVLRYVVDGANAPRVARVLPGPGASNTGALLVAGLAVLLVSRRWGARAVLALSCGAIWLVALAVPEDWWAPAHGARGFVGVAAESVVQPTVYAIVHVLQYPAAYVLFGLILVEAFELFTDTSWLAAPPLGRAVRYGAAPAVFLAVWLVFGPALRSLPLGQTGSDGKYRWGLPGFQISTTDVSYLPGWAQWNFSGYERKAPRADSGGYNEFYALIQMVTEVGADPEYGCGRSMWEYGPRLEGYGTPMAPMLLPHFTDGCIGSMEGLYFEASSTTPYHFLNQSALSKQPSSAQRDLPYPGFDIDLGVKQLQLLGVRYYLAFSDTAVAAAQGHPELREIASAGPWHMFLVESSALVQPLAYSPVVYTNVSNRQSDWLQPAAQFFNDPTQYDVLRAASGPQEWPRFTIPETAKENAADLAKARAEAERTGGTIEDPTIPNPPKVSLPAVQVANITSDDDEISFDVDRIGVPVLVKASYFPNWVADGAKGPYRVTPNFMVVIPTSEHVRLRYAYLGIDYAAWGLTFIGIALLAALFLRRPPPVEPPFWDPLGHLGRRAPQPSEPSEPEQALAPGESVPVGAARPAG